MKRRGIFWSSRTFTLTHLQIQACFWSLVASPASEWGEALDSSLIRGVSQLGSDTSYVLVLQFRKHFPDIPILPALGNEDAFACCQRTAVPCSRPTGEEFEKCQANADNARGIRR